MALVEQQRVEEATRKAFQPGGEMAYAYRIDQGERTTVEINSESRTVIWYVPEKYLEVDEPIVPDNHVSLSNIDSPIIADNEASTLEMEPTKATELGEKVIDGSDVIRDAVTCLEDVGFPGEFYVMNVHEGKQGVVVALITRLPPVPGRMRQ